MKSIKSIVARLGGGGGVEATLWGGRNDRLLAFIRCNVYSCACCHYKSYHLDDDIISTVIASLEVRARRRYIVSEL